MPLEVRLGLQEDAVELGDRARSRQARPRLNGPRPMPTKSYAGVGFRTRGQGESPRYCSAWPAIRSRTAAMSAAVVSGLSRVNFR